MNASGNTNIKGNLSVTGNTTVSGNTKLKAVSGTVNSCENVKLGVPIGSIVAWPGCGCPAGWHQCNGDAITAVTLATSIGSDTSSYYYVKFSTGESTYSSNRFIKIPKSYSKNVIELLLVLMGSNIGTLQDSNYFIAYYYDTSYVGRLYPTTMTSWSGSKTIYYPNLSGRFIFGRQNKFGATGGSSAHTMTIKEMPKHTHDIMSEWSQQDVTGNNISRQSYGHSSLAGDGETSSGEGFSLFAKNGIRTYGAPWDDRGDNASGRRVIMGVTWSYKSPFTEPLIRPTGTGKSFSMMPPYMEMDWIIKVS